MDEFGMNGLYNTGMNWGYWLAMFVMGGTNIWTIVMYFLERKKRKLEMESTSAEVDQKELNTVKDQFELFDKRLEKNSKGLLDAENLIETLRKQNQELQKEKYQLEMKILTLEQIVKKKEKNECLKADCPERVRGAA